MQEVLAKGPREGAGGRGDPSPTNLYSSSKYMTRIEREHVDVEKRAKDDQIHGHAYDKNLAKMLLFLKQE